MNAIRRAMLLACLASVLAPPCASAVMIETGMVAGEFDPAATNYGDGSVSDWGIAGIANAYDMGNAFWQPTRPGAGYWLEDGVDRRPRRNRGRVGPGLGGQNFDIEAAYLGAHENAVSLAIVTGFDAAGQRQRVRGRRVLWTPGDVFLDLDGNGAWDLAVAVTGRAGVAAGSVFIPTGAYRGGVWWTDAERYPDSGAFQADLARVELLPPEALLGLEYTDAVVGEFASASRRRRRWNALDHNIIEVGLSLDSLATYWPELDLGAQITAHWTQQGGNDVLDLFAEHTREPLYVIPEPATLTLTLASLAGLALAARRKARRAH